MMMMMMMIIVTLHLSRSSTDTLGAASQLDVAISPCDPTKIAGMSSCLSVRSSLSFFFCRD
jgi:hypothetical protein